MFDLAAIQKTLREFGLDGWLLYDFRGSNVLARRVLDLEQKPAGSRRFLYMIPAVGAAGASSSTASRPGRSTTCPAARSCYLPWQELEAGIGEPGRGHEARGDGVLPARRQPVRLQGRRRHGRARPGLRRRGRSPRAT